MAMPGTHLRFAVTLADKLAIKDLSAYLSGTLYPDSRWTTGVERKMTHDPRFLDPDFPTDDFTLGWHLHCLCDQIQQDLLGRFLAKLTGLSSDEQWIRMSAAKVVQDMNDAKNGELENYLSLLVCCQTPFGESCEEIESFFGSVQRAYGGKKSPSWIDYARLWLDIELAPERVHRIEQQVDQLLMDEKRLPGIRGVFDQMIERWETADTLLQGWTHWTKTSI